MKSIYFLGGLPRSGNTLLSAILNQNPNVYCSPISPLLDHIKNLDEDLKLNEKNQIFNWEETVVRNIQSYAQLFYEHRKEPIIIDRHKGWGSANSISNAAKYITNKPRILFTVRDIPSILASYLVLLGKGTDTFLDNHINAMGIYKYGNQTHDDLRCDVLMNYNGLIQLQLLFLTEALQLNLPIHLIEYDDLINEPDVVMQKAYDFLEIEPYNHDFKNITKLEIETPEAGGLPSNIHDIRKELSKVSPSPESVLSKLSLAKYSNLEFWRN